MDKLRDLNRRRTLTVILSVAALALLSTTGGFRTLPAVFAEQRDSQSPGDPTAAGPGPAPGIAAIESLTSVDWQESQRTLAESVDLLTRRWSDLGARLPASADSSLIAGVWRKEAGRAAECLRGVLDDRGSSPEARAELVRTCLKPARRAEALLPVVEALARGERSGALVVTSVGCECVMNACARMSALYDSLSAAEPEIPLARFDDMDLPEIAEGWDLYQIPTWVFLEATGTVGFMLEGTEVGNPAVLAEIGAWMRAPQPAPEE